MSHTDSKIHTPAWVGRPSGILVPDTLDPSTGLWVPQSSEYAAKHEVRRVRLFIIEEE